MLDTIETETAPNPTASVIVLHGLGADGNDFVPIAEQLDLSTVGPMRFIFPHAPTMPVTINGGYVMRAWYDVFGRELESSTPREDEAGLRTSQALVEALIAKERERGIAAKRIVLAGFSQGCAMALITGLRQGERLAGPESGPGEEEECEEELHGGMGAGQRGSGAARRRESG